jgi:hypothetical protein
MCPGLPELTSVHVVGGKPVVRVVSAMVLASAPGAHSPIGARSISVDVADNDDQEYDKDTREDGTNNAAPSLLPIVVVLPRFFVLFIGNRELRSLHRGGFWKAIAIFHVRRTESIVLVRSHGGIELDDCFRNSRQLGNESFLHCSRFAPAIVEPKVDVSPLGLFRMSRQSQTGPMSVVGRRFTTCLYRVGYKVLCTGIKPTSRTLLLLYQEVL